MRGIAPLWLAAAVVLGPGCVRRLPLLPVCGDGILDATEGCDDGNEESGDGCDAGCRVERCGDGVVNDRGHETCDDGNHVDADGCSAACKLEICGDGVRDAGEACDDGNTRDNDGCSATCAIERCGDGAINNRGETCDDGNTESGDGCSAACKQEICGDQVVDVGESCDDGNHHSGDGCDAQCKREICGDGVVNNLRLEACDDGNVEDGDGCDARCRVESCGDGRVNNAGTEACDDGNTVSGDGCSATCKREVCGDGVLDANEECDGAIGDATCVNLGAGFSGGALACDAQCRFATSACKPRPLSCLNGQNDLDAQNGEQCDGTDFGNQSCSSLGFGAGGVLTCTDGCTLDASACDVPPLCGNGVVEVGEQCDPSSPSPLTCDEHCNPVAELNHCTDGVDNDGNGIVDCDDPQCITTPVCALLVGPPGSLLQDVARDGQRIGIIDPAAATLELVAPDGGPPTVVASNVSAAIFAGDVLVAMYGLNPVTHVAISADVFMPSGVAFSVPSLSAATLDASPDGQHLYNEVDLADGLEQLMLDGVVIVPQASKEKVRFTPDSAFLVVGANLDTATAAGPHFVATFPVGGGPPHSICADQAANQTAVTRDSSSVLFGANEATNLVTLEIAPVAGGDAVVLDTGVEDSGFRSTVDDGEIIYVLNRDLAPPLGRVLVAVHRDGTGKRIIHDNAKRLISISSSHVVYARTFAAATGAGEYHIVRLDGAGDALLGNTAVREDFTPDGRYYVFRDDVVGGVGTLRTFDTALGAPLVAAYVAPKARVLSVAIASSRLLVFLDTGGILRKASPDGAAVETVAADVAAFKLVRDVPDGDASRVVFQTPQGVFVQHL